MKTSNKLLLTGLILAAVSLVGYDLMLRSSYLAGDYKNPYRDYVSLNFKDFKSINLSASTVANMVVTQGPFSVKITPDAADFVKVSQKGDTLHIDVEYKGRYFNIREAYVLQISCPTLAHIDEDSKYLATGKLAIDSLASDDFKWRPNIFSGFTLDSLSIVERHASSIILKRNKIRSVKAVVGIGGTCRSNMIITDDNQFQNADLDILNHSQLELHNAHIVNLKYHLADSTKLIQYGGTPNILKKQN